MLNWFSPGAEVLVLYCLWSCGLVSKHKVSFILFHWNISMSYLDIFQAWAVWRFLTFKILVSLNFDQRTFSFCHYFEDYLSTWPGLWRPPSGWCGSTGTRSPRVRPSPTTPDTASSPSRSSPLTRWGGWTSSWKKVTSGEWKVLQNFACLDGCKQHS